MVSAAILMSLTLVGCEREKNGERAISPATPKTPESAISAIQKAAEDGDVMSQFELAKKYGLGEGVELDQAKAFGWFLKAAEGGNVDAMVAVALRLEDGEGTKPDAKRARSWWRKAAELGNARAAYECANELGYTSRRSVLIWDSGTETSRKNAALYLDWLTKSSDQGYLRAKHDLAMTYFLGATESGAVLIPQNPEKGLQLLREAADAGYWNSIWAMAVLYQAGFANIKPDKAESEKYWTSLLKQSGTEVHLNIAWLYNEESRNTYRTGQNKYRGKNLTFEESNEIAHEWFTKAAEQNNRVAIRELGRQFRSGRGAWKDEQKAYEYLKRAAEMGDYEAMRVLAFSLIQGEGVAKNYAEAYQWLSRAARDKDESKYSRVHSVRNALGALHEFGWGVDKDLVIAYAWYNLAAAGGDEKAKQNLVRVEKSLKASDVREAQSLSAEWKTTSQMTRSQSPPSERATTTDSQGQAGGNGKLLKVVSSGSGFFISQHGDILTNHHVVKDCKELRIPAENVVAKVVVADPTNDLALLKSELTGRSSVQFPTSDDLSQGEEVFVFGFPLDGYLPAAGNITPGIVSALAGPGNNSGLVQITAPVQPGNSGGPLFNKTGRVIGVVVGKADAIKIAKLTGDIPQNINFAIAPRLVKSFLDGNGVAYQKSSDWLAVGKGSVAIAEQARRSTIKLECWR
jgi:TPR repeat protein